MDICSRDELVKKTGRGVMWNLYSQILQYTIRFFVIFILARLLDPSDFGVFAMAMVFIEFVEPLREWGFQAALIYRKEIDEEYRSTAFWSICVVGLSLYLLILISSRFIGKFFNNSEVSQILPFIAFGMLFTPFGAIQWAMLTRELKFNTIANRNILAEVLYGATACVLAFNNFGVWSFVIGTIVREFTWTFALWFSYKWRPSFIFSVVKFKEILNYGINCMGSSIINSLTNNVDNLIVGKFLGTIKLGYYNLAYNTVNHPQTKLVSQISSVAFPFFSIIQDEKERSKNAYEKTIKVILLSITPILAVLFVSADKFILVFYGIKWLQASLIIQIMCFYGFLKAVSFSSGAIFLSKGKTATYFKINLFKFVLFLLMLLFGVRYGLVGVAIAVLFHSIIVFIPTFYFACKILDLSCSRIYFIVLRYILLYLIIVGIIWCCDRIILRYFDPIPLIFLIINMFLGLIIYLTILAIFIRSDLYLMVDLVKKTFRK